MENETPEISDVPELSEPIETPEPPKASEPPKGYQKKPAKEKPSAPPKPKQAYAPGYTSPTAKNWPKFREALENGNIEVVKKLIEEGVNVNVTRDGITPLFLAASKANRELAEVLIQAGANVNAKDPDNWTALHKAVCDQAGTGIVELLINSGIDVNALTITKKTALQYAEESNHADIVKFIKQHLQGMQADDAEWRAFLETPEGKPFKQAQLLETIDAAFSFLWAPPAGLLLAGLLFGLLFGSAVVGGVIGVLCGILVDAAVYYRQMQITNYLAEFEPLPHLDIRLLRKKRKAGEDLGVRRRGKAQKASGPVMLSSTTVPPPVAPAAAFAPEISLPEKKAGEKHSQPVPRQTGPTSDLNPWQIVTAVMVLVLLLLGGSLFIYQEPLLRWYYVKKVEGKGIQFTDSAFLAEVAENDEEAVDLFINAGADLEARDEAGRTALMIASEKGYDRLYDKFLHLNRNLLNQTDARGNTALMLAAQQGREAIVRSLVENGAEVNYLSPAAEGAANALQTAADASDPREEHLKIILFLLEKGADVNGRNMSGQFPLLFAAARGREEVVRTLIGHGADVNAVDQKGGFALRSAASKGHAKLITLLAEKGANIKAAAPDGTAPLMDAAQQGHLEAVRTLLELGAPVNAVATNGTNALAAACSGGNIDVVRLLLGKGADPGAVVLPEAFTGLAGRSVAVTARKSRMAETVKRLAVSAAQDGYKVSAAPGMDRKLTYRMTGPWNRVLIDLAQKNKLLLVVKDKEVTVVPYDSAAIR